MSSEPESILFNSPSQQVIPFSFHVVLHSLILTCHDGGTPLTVRGLDPAVVHLTGICMRSESGVPCSMVFLKGSPSDSMCPE